MDDLISRQAAMDAVENAFDRETILNRFVRKIAISALRKMPSAQPERKRGKWIYGEKDGPDGWYCSECGFFIPWYYEYYGLDNIDFIADYHTCPNCGAEMRGEQDETD